jgi:hypothetical protein
MKDTIDKLKFRIEQLEAALADAHLDLSIEKEYVQMACNIIGVDSIDEFKKNPQHFYNIFNN